MNNYIFFTSTSTSLEIFVIILFLSLFDIVGLICFIKSQNISCSFRLLAQFGCSFCHSLTAEICLFCKTSIVSLINCLLFFAHLSSSLIYKVLELENLYIKDFDKDYLQFYNTMLENGIVDLENLDIPFN